MLHQRRPRKDECNNDELSNESIQRRRTSPYNKRSRIVLSWIVSFIVGMIIIVVWWVIHWRREVWIHGKECDMTYSRPNYIPISTKGNHNSFYQLYQFVDWDDIYHRSLLDSSSNKVEFCNNDDDGSWIVLFVPGYGGSYKQVRSLGNHIIHHPHYYYHNHKIKIITLEWIQDGGLIWDADLLQHYVIQLQQLLISCCTTTNITIVAHSIGGIVSRMALHPNHNNHQQTLSNINLITLATPHVQFPYTYFWDTTHMKHYNFHTTYNNNNNNNIISISAGIRDELIPNILTFIPHHTTTTNNNNNIILVPKLGMDHQAIVWCHSVLHTIVDQYIFNTTTNIVQTKTFEQIQTEALNTHGILSNGLLLITMPYTLCYILLNIYPTTILLHHILLQLFFTKTTTEKKITIMTFLLQSLIQLTLWKYPYYDPISKNITTFTIIFTCGMNAFVTILYYLHRRALGFICNILAHNNHTTTTTTLHRQISWNKSFILLFIICFIPSYYIINCGGYSTIFIQMICHLWTIWTFQPLLSSLMRQTNNDNNHWIVMTLMAFLPMYCIYFIRQCIIYYFFYALNVVTTFHKISPSFFVSHLIIPLWNQFILPTTTTTTSNPYVANYNKNT